MGSSISSENCLAKDMWNQKGWARYSRRTKDACFCRCLAGVASSQIEAPLCRLEGTKDEGCRVAYGGFSCVSQFKIGSPEEIYAPTERSNWNYKYRKPLTHQEKIDIFDKGRSWIANIVSFHSRDGLVGLEEPMATNHRGPRICSCAYRGAERISRPVEVLRSEGGRRRC
nr:uncharacterized protein LOC109732221 isoform X2 [Aegilops tauschii subsp. strangulata]